MTIFTTCTPQYQQFDLEGDLQVRLPPPLVPLSVLTSTCTQERNDEIKLALKQFLPEVQHTDENFAQVRLHFVKDGCKEQFFRPLSDLITGKVVPDSEDTIHLHEAKTDSAGQQKHPVPAGSQGLSGSDETGSDEKINDENNDGDNGENNDETNDKTNDETNDETNDKTDDKNNEKTNDRDKNLDGDDQDTPSQPSIESQLTDTPTNVMDKDLAEDQLYIKVIFDLRGAPHISKKWLDVKEFPEEVLHFRRQRSLPEIFTLLAGFVTQRLKDQEKECYDDLNEKKPELFLLPRPLLIHDCPMKQRAFEFDDSGISRVAVVNDLLSGTVDNEAALRGEAADEQTRQPQLTIKLKLIDAVPKVAITDPLVMIRPGAEKKDTGGGARFYRIGTRLVPDEVEKRLVDTSDACFWRCRFADDLTGLAIVRASMWSLRGLDVCNPDEGRAIGKKDSNLTKGMNEAPLNPEGFKKAMRNGTVRSYTEGRLLYNFKAWSNLDILPGYPLKRVKTLPKKDLTVAIRYHSHLPFEEAQQLEFPIGEEIIFDARDLDRNKNHKVFCNQIRDNLEVPANAPLFSKRRAESWTIDVWVMPQVPEGRTLFRFAVKDTLADYLHAPCVAEGDMALFAEVHLCPVSPKETTTKSGRKVQSKEE
jgi:hypothetical protein